jgi:hypothetical protein
MFALTSISGLPAHPLFAHIPVVLIPLAAIGAVAMLWPRVRDRIGWVVVGIVFVAGITTQLAVDSGQGLKEYVRESRLMQDHARMGENIRPWVLLMFLALLGVMIVARFARRRDEVTQGRDPLKIAGIVLAALSIVFSGMATYWIYKIGHSGSKAVWAPTQVKIDKGGGERGGEGNKGG